MVITIFLGRQMRLYITAAELVTLEHGMNVTGQMSMIWSIFMEL